jgi:hypothetical protein
MVTKKLREKYDFENIMSILEEKYEFENTVQIFEQKLNNILLEQGSSNQKEANKAITYGYIAMIAAAIYIAKRIYKKFLSQGARACKNAKNKNECMKDFKIKALQKEIEYLKGKKSYCSKTSNPEACKKVFDKKIQKKHDEIIRVSQQK